MMNVSEEELYNLPTAEYVNRRGGFVLKQFTVYHVAIHACAELQSKEVCYFAFALPFVTTRWPCLIDMIITLVPILHLVCLRSHRGSEVSFSEILFT